MSHAATLDRLEARIAALQDIEAIEALKSRYWRALDRKRPDDVQDCLAPDASIDFEGLPRYESREAFMQMARQAATAPGTFGMHHGQNPRITLTGENTAEGEWDIFYHGIDTQAGTLTQMAGAYHDTYRRENNRWWIATMQMRIKSLHVQRAAKTLIFGEAK